MSRTIRLPLFWCVLFVFLSGCHEVRETPPISIPEVVVATVEVRDVQPYIHTTGYTEAYEFVQIPARVSGFLREIRYTPGSIVEAGTPLFLIEPNQYAAEVKSAEAQLASAKAQLKLSKANLERTKLLITQGAMTEQDLETDQAKADEADAAVLHAAAQLDTARLNLSYTDVRSPIPGKTDRNFIDVGNLVGPSALGGGDSEQNNHSVLTTVAGMDPIYVYFEISDYQFNNLRKFAKENKNPAVTKLIEQLKKVKESRKNYSPDDALKPEEVTKPEEAAKPESGEPTQKTPENKTAETPKAAEKEKMGEKKGDLEDLDVGFEISLIKGADPNVGDYPFKGIIDMTSNKINRSTGTITIRGEIPNTDYEIFPEQICRVRIPVWIRKDAVLVKQDAIGTDLNQRYVYVVDEKNIAHRRLVVLGEPQSDGTRVVEKGLEKGERYVISGIQKTRDGSEVKIVEPPKTEPEAKPAAEKKPEESKPEESKPEANTNEPKPAANTNELRPAVAE